MTDETGVLSGLRVIDLSRGIAGPMTTMMLADQGAEVLRIEPPSGDPFSAQPGYRVWNRGKRSAGFDLKNDVDRQAFLALARHTDVLVESYAPGVTQRLGIDYETLRSLNPRLIYCSITAYGRKGRHAHRPGYDALVAARVGGQWEQRGWPEGAVNHMSGRPDPFMETEFHPEWVQGASRAGPLFTGSRWPSLGAFFVASAAISAALRARELTGRGQWVETSLMQGMLAGMFGVLQRVENPDAKLFDSWILGSRSPKGHFQCADGGWVHNWVPNPRFILQAAKGSAIDSHPNLRAKDDPDRFGTGPEELLVMNYYQPLMAAAIRKFSSKDWVNAAAVAGMTMQPVRSPEESLNDPSFLADGCVVELQDPVQGVIRCAGLAYDFSATPGCVRGAAPLAGAQSEQIRALAEESASAWQPQPHARTGRTLAAPLEGVIVLDLGLAIAGPFGTQILSDLGADVIKINALHDTYWHSNHIAYSANRGKRSIALNLKDPRGMKILLELVRKADVIQHNMRYDAAERLGIDYENLKKINPTLIYCHSRGFERSGLRVDLPGNDQTGACLTGVQWEDGGMAGGGKPLWSLTSMGDTGNGFLTAIAIMQALYHRERTGEGQMCNTSIVNACLLNTSYTYAFPDGSGPARFRVDENQLGFHAGYRLYETKSGWLCVALVTDAHWGALARVLRDHGLDIGSRIASRESRLKNDAELASLLENVLGLATAEEWFEQLDKAGVPCEISDPEFTHRFHDDSEMQERGLTVAYEHAFVGRLEQVGLLFEFSETPGRVQGPPLIVGDCTRAIMRELGYDDVEITRACEEGYAAAWGEGEVPNRFTISPWAPGKGEGSSQ